MGTTPSRSREDLQAVPAQFKPLHKYLEKRYADAVVLRFSEIEDLLGCPLPADARQSADWWLPPPDGGLPSDASRAWRLAGRTAVPNLAAGSVRFERE